VDQIRSLAEHYPEDVFLRDAQIPEVFRTRDVINSWFDSAFVVTRGVNYHLSHHLCPQIPFYNLADLQTQLAESPVYQQYAHVTYGYHRVLAEYFFHRAEPVGHVGSAPTQSRLANAS
jgi:fatty acid desaturase